MSQDVRWKQRFSNFKKAYTQLSEFMLQQDLNKLEEQGLIQAFEYTHELAWKTLADFIKDKGNSEIYGSKDATREAFNLGLIDDGAVWMEMVKSHNMTSHTYNEETTKQIATAIKNDYYPAFASLQNKLEELI